MNTHNICFLCRTKKNIRLFGRKHTMLEAMQDETSHVCMMIRAKLFKANDIIS